MKSAIYKDNDGRSVAKMQVGEILDWPYYPPLDEGDAVAGYVVTVSGTGLTNGDDGQVGDTVYVFVTATAVSTDAKIRYTVTTAGGRTFVDDLFINIEV